MKYSFQFFTRVSSRKHESMEVTLHKGFDLHTELQVVNRNSHPRKTAKHSQKLTTALLLISQTLANTIIKLTWISCNWNSFFSEFWILYFACFLSFICLFPLHWKHPSWKRCAGASGSRKKFKEWNSCSRIAGKIGVNWVNRPVRSTRWSAKLRVSWHGSAWLIVSQQVLHSTLRLSVAGNGLTQRSVFDRSKWEQSRASCVLWVCCKNMSSSLKALRASEWWKSLSWMQGGERKKKN